MRKDPMETNERPPVTYILPTVAWAMLLEPIAQDAPVGAVIEVHTDEMRVLAEQTPAELSRPDLTVHLRPPRQPVHDQAA